MCDSITSAEQLHPNDPWAQNLTLLLKGKEKLKEADFSINSCGVRWGSWNICLAFIPPYCFVDSSIRPTAGVLGETHAVLGNTAGISSKSSMELSELFARPLVEAEEMTMKSNRCFVSCNLLPLRPRNTFCQLFKCQIINVAALKSSLRSFVQENTEYPVKTSFVWLLKQLQESVTGSY